MTFVSNAAASSCSALWAAYGGKCWHNICRQNCLMAINFLVSLLKKNWNNVSCPNSSKLFQWPMTGILTHGEDVSRVFSLQHALEACFRSYPWKKMSMFAPLWLLEVKRLHIKSTMGKPFTIYGWECTEERGTHWTCLGSKKKRACAAKIRLKVRRGFWHKAFWTDLFRNT